MLDHFPLPYHGKPERRHLFRWIKEEMVYAHDKYFSGRIGNRGEAVNERQKQDGSWTGGIDEYWRPYVLTYLDRAAMWLEQAMAMPEGDIRRQELIMKAMQAMGKSTMTSLAMCESAIRTFGPMPKPGSSSTEPVQHWVDPAFEAVRADGQDDLP